MSDSPRTAAAVLGHDAAVHAFRSAWAAGRLHHAWLLHGPEGIGKATLAFRLARIVLGAEDMASPEGRRVSAGTHADLLVIRRGFDEKRGRPRAEIVMDDVAPIQQFLRRTAAEAGWRVVLIDGAEYLNRNAANALLKLLEEPPPKAVILMTSAAPGRLLPTIRSRCRRLGLDPLDGSTMRAVLTGQGQPDDVIARLIAEGAGAPGRAARLALDSDGAIADFVSGTLDGTVAPSAILAQSERIARQDDGFAVFTELLGARLAMSARAAGHAGDVAAAAAQARAFRAIEDLRRETERFNLDKAVAVQMAVAVATGDDQAGS
nr:DNA polymerase III subunit delta' [Tanticharoenia sakaeratensis]